MGRTAELVPYANYARTHTPDQVKQIAASIREFRRHLPHRGLTVRIRLSLQRRVTRTFGPPRLKA
jgi:hypothetical protein